MSYNSANLSFANVALPNAIQNSLSNVFIWKYTTTDNMATVLGSDPITGWHYFYGENKFRMADWIGLTASDGDAVAYVTGSTTSGTDVTIKQWNPSVSL